MLDRCHPAAESASITYLQEAGPRMLSALPLPLGTREDPLKPCHRTVKLRTLSRAGCPPEPKSALGRRPYWDAMRWAASPLDQTQTGLPGILSSGNSPTEHSNESEDSEDIACLGTGTAATTLC